MIIKKLLLSIWELPQNILGFVVKNIYKASYVENIGNTEIYLWSIGGGMSLGKYIFVCDPMDMKLVRHEYGHTIQSELLGWLYIPVIGIPSFIWANCFEGYRNKTGKSYYWLYTERWADKLGGVKR